MSIIDEIRAMSPEEKTALSNALKDLEPKPAPVVKQLGEPMIDPASVDAYGNPLSAEEIYDRAHPLKSLLWPWDYSETMTVFGHDPVTKKYKKEEIIQHNKPIIEAWLKEKRKFFPDAKLPAFLRDEWNIIDE